MPTAHAGSAYAMLLDDNRKTAANAASFHQPGSRHLLFTANGALVPVLLSVTCNNLGRLPTAQFPCWKGEKLVILPAIIHCYRCVFCCNDALFLNSLIILLYDQPTNHFLL